MKLKEEDEDSDGEGTLSYIEKNSEILHEFLMIEKKQKDMLPRMMIDPNSGPKTVWNMLMLVLVIF